MELIYSEVRIEWTVVASTIDDEEIHRRLLGVRVGSSCGASHRQLYDNNRQQLDREGGKGRFNRVPRF